VSRSPRPQPKAKEINFRVTVRFSRQKVSKTYMGRIGFFSFYDLRNSLTKFFLKALTSNDSHIYYWRDSNEDVMSGVCGTYGEKCIQDFALQTSRKEF
jgi:hypothetical protein